MCETGANFADSEEAAQMLATKRLKSVHGASTEPTTAAAAAAAAVAEATVRYGRSSASGRSRVEQDMRRRSTSTRCQATNCHTFGCKRCRVAAPRMVASTGAKADEKLQSGGGQVGTRCLRINCFKFGCTGCSTINRTTDPMAVDPEHVEWVEICPKVDRTVDYHSTPDWTGNDIT